LDVGFAAAGTRQLDRGFSPSGQPGIAESLGFAHETLLQ
jgi:hypothetical protein